MPRPAHLVDRRHALGGSLAQSPLPSLLSALLVGAALLGAAVLVWAGVRWWRDARAAAGPRVIVVETQTPASPVDALDRVYLATRIANPGDQRLENLWVELEVVGPDGKVALRSRQGGIAIGGHDVRAIYWAWRVPGAAAPGTYRARVDVVGADGRLLGSSDGAAPSFEIRGRS